MLNSITAISDINVKGHRKHLDGRVHILSLREICGWSANKIPSERWNPYQLNDISKSGLLSFVKRTTKRDTVQDLSRSGRSRSKKTKLNIRKTRQRHLNKQNPGQRATTDKLNTSNSSVQKILKEDLKLKSYHKTMYI